MKESFKKSFSYFLKGSVIGLADLIPGISGGSIAFIFGIYEKILVNIKNFDVFLFFTFRWKKLSEKIEFSFLFFLVLGAIFSIITFSGLFYFLLMHKFLRPILLSFFFGSMIAAINIIRKKITFWTIGHLLGFLLGSCIVFSLIKIEGYRDAIIDASFNVETFFCPYIIFSGSIAILATMLPGISGSCILMVLGLYAPTLQAISSFIYAIKEGSFHLSSFYFLINLAVGILIGFSLFSRMILYLFKRFEMIMLSIIIGMMVSSLYLIWPFWHFGNNKVPLHPTYPIFFSFQFFLSTISFLVAIVIFHQRKKNSITNVYSYRKIVDRD